MIDIEILKTNILKNTKGNSSLEKQAFFFADAIAEFAPKMPDIWTGGGSSKGKPDYKSIRFCWRNDRNDKWIEMCLYDNAMGWFNVNGNSSEIRWIATEKGAREAFESAFRYIFGE